MVKIVKVDEATTISANLIATHELSFDLIFNVKAIPLSAGRSARLLPQMQSVSYICVIEKLARIKSE